LWKPTLVKSGYNQLRNVIVIIEKTRNLFVFIVTAKELEDENQWAPQEGVWQSYGFRRKSSQIEVVPTIKNVAEGVHLVKGGNILKYRAKTNAYWSQGAIALWLH